MHVRNELTNDGSMHVNRPIGHFVGINLLDSIEYIKARGTVAMQYTFGSITKG